VKIFHNAHVYSPDDPSSTAFVIDQGRFLALGQDSTILESFSHPQQVINLQGKTVWPGLTDAHVHLSLLAESMAKIQCETPTLSECLNRVEDTAKRYPEGEWVQGHGWNHNRWQEGYGTANLLDTVSDGHPIYLTAKSLHAAWANSKALEIACIDASTPDPPGGVIQRDQNGKPDGILLEMAAMSLVESAIPKPTPQALTAMIRKLIPELWRMGLVGLHDFDRFECWQALQTLNQRGDLKFRIRKNVPHQEIEKFIDAGVRTDFGDDWLHIGGVKLFADGALGPQTAAMHQPYDGSGELGSLLLSENEIIAIGKQAANHGLALTIHAIGDRANHVVLNAFNELRTYEASQQLPHLRHRIEHVQIIDPADLPRLTELNIVASVQPIHAPSDMAMADKYLGARAANAYAYRSMIEAGACVAFGSDAPVEPINPFQGIHAAVTRCKVDGTPSPEGWHPEQKISLNQAIKAFSYTPAIITNRGDRLGKIAPGFKADFLILDQDPCKIASQDLYQIEPAATYIEGECVYHSKNLSIANDYL